MVKEAFLEKMSRWQCCSAWNCHWIPLSLDQSLSLGEAHLQKSRAHHQDVKMVNRRIVLNNFQCPCCHFYILGKGSMFGCSAINFAPNKNDNCAQYSVDKHFAELCGFLPQNQCKKTRVLFWSLCLSFRLQENGKQLRILQIPLKGEGRI